MNPSRFTHDVISSFSTLSGSNFRNPLQSLFDQSLNTAPYATPSISEPSDFVRPQLFNIANPLSSTVPYTDGMEDLSAHDVAEFYGLRVIGEPSNRGRLETPETRSDNDFATNYSDTDYGRWEDAPEHILSNLNESTTFASDQPGESLEMSSLNDDVAKEPLPSSNASEISEDLPSYKEFEEDLPAIEETAESIETGAEAAEAVGGEASGGAGLVLMAGQMAASGINSYLNSSINSGITSQYQKNIQSPGLNSGLNAALIAQHNQANKDLIDAGGTIGSLFGPLGTLAGRQIASSFTSDIPMSTLDTAYSAYGRIDPQSDGINSTQSSVNASGEQFENGYQQSASSSSQDSSEINDGNSAS